MQDDNINVRVGSLWKGSGAGLWIVMKVCNRTRTVTFRRFSPYMRMSVPLDVIHSIFYCISE